MNQKGALSISSDKERMKITSLDGGTVYFEGDEEQAWRVSSYVGPIVGGGRLYAYYEGDIFKSGRNIRFVAQDAAGLGTIVEVEIEGVVRKVSVIFLDGN
jgi:hypothetical protein